MNKTVLKVVGVVALGIVLGVAVRGFTDAKGYTTYTP